MSIGAATSTNGNTSRIPSALKGNNWSNINGNIDNGDM